MRIAVLAAAMLAMLSPSIVSAQAAAPAASAATVAATPGHYSVEDTDIGTLLDDPASKAVLDKHMPSLSTSPQVDMARSLTLGSLKQYAPEQVNDKILADIQTDLNKLPAKK